MDINLVGKNAIICGASKGIGRAAAIEMAQLGANLTILARNAQALEDVLSTLDNTQGQNHQALTVDFSNPANLKKAISSFMEEYKAPIHILVNNSGGPAAGPAHLAKEEEFISAFNQHLIGSHIMVQAVLDGMKKESYGRIINIISTSVKMPIKGLGVSNTIRGAVANWSKTLSFELGQYGITVNNILPGATDTDRLGEIIEGKASKLGKSTGQIIDSEKEQIPAGRFGFPEELAQAIAFIASPAASYINGINLPVDGGRTGCL
jgi:3-oxoacyl-[acyl-carrier protein] reductase